MQHVQYRVNVCSRGQYYDQRIKQCKNKSRNIDIWEELWQLATKGKTSAVTVMVIHTCLKSLRYYVVQLIKHEDS